MKPNVRAKRATTAGRQGPVGENVPRTADRALVVPIPAHRCWSVADLAQACPQLAPCLEAAADPRSGLEQLMAAASAEPAGAEPCPVVAGSLHLLGEVIPWLDRPQGV